MDNPIPFFIAAAVCFAIIVALFVYARIYIRRERAKQNNMQGKKLKDRLEIGTQNWIRITAFFVGVAMMAAIVAGIVIVSSNAKHTPTTQTAVVTVPTVVAENGQPFVQLRADKGGTTLVYLCAPNECSGLTIGNRVQYTAYIDERSGEWMFSEIQRV